MSTNQRMEVYAVLDALRAIDGSIEIVSDSTYVVHCFRDRWWEGWLRKGWRNSQKKPVANRDLWEPLIEAYRADPQRVRFRWVKGHSGDPMNDLVDRLAVEAAQTQRPRRGDAPPSAADLGPADSMQSASPRSTSAPSSGSSASSGSIVDGLVPEGRKVVVVGHRPPALGGYEENLTTAELRRRVAEILAAKKDLHPDLVVMTGMGLGAEQVGAEAAAIAGVPYYAVLAYPDTESVWPPLSQERFRALLAGAAGTIVLQTARPETKQKAGAALSRRDAWLYRYADEAIAVWDGKDDVVGRMVRSLVDHLGADEVWTLTP